MADDAGRIFQFPYNSGNPYISIQREMLESVGFSVVPLVGLSWWRARHWLDVAVCPNSHILLNWVENVAFSSTASGRRTSLKGMLKIVVILMVLFFRRLCRIGRIVYVVHNDHVLDALGRHRVVATFIQALLRRLATNRVVHLRGAQLRYRAIYIPHPLYTTGASPVNSASPEAGAQALFFGRLDGYKNLYLLIQYWPMNVRLKIMGLGAEGVVDKIRQAVQQRGLCVDIVNTRFTEEDLEAELARSAFVVHPHLPGTMLVSGTFFRAAAARRIIVAQSSAFIDEMGRKYSFVRPYSDIRDIAAVIKAISSERSPELSRFKLDRDFERLEREHAHWLCKQVWRQVFNPDGKKARSNG